MIVQPNNDTLYTMGHLDLARTALVLHVPKVSGHRYYSFEFLDPYTNVFRYVGTRTTGDGAGNFLITGPGLPRTGAARSAPDPLGLPALWLVGRTLVRGAADLPAVHRVQDGYRTDPAGRLAGSRPGLARAPAGARGQPPSGRRRARGAWPSSTRWAPRWPRTPRRPATPRSCARCARSASVRACIHPPSTSARPCSARCRPPGDSGYQHVFTVRTAIAAQSVLRHDGWFVPPFINGAFGTDYAYRAVVALFGIAANRPQEALYIVGVTDPTHAYLDGSHSYVIHFAPGQLPPARYFWSLTMYDQNFFLVSNPLGRYALGSDTPGLRRNPDGSLDIYVQHTAPAGHLSNWLPAPASGHFEVTMRLYGPRADRPAGPLPLPADHPDG